MLNYCRLVMNKLSNTDIFKYIMKGQKNSIEQKTADYEKI